MQKHTHAKQVYDAAGDVPALQNVWSSVAVMAHNSWSAHHLDIFELSDKSHGFITEQNNQNSVPRRAGQGVTLRSGANGGLYRWCQLRILIKSHPVDSGYPVFNAIVNPYVVSGGPVVNDSEPLFPRPEEKVVFNRASKPARRSPVPKL